ncbi:MAG: sulfite exporter TauE/SafE family protein [Pseudomonadota bacterium]
MPRLKNQISGGVSVSEVSQWLPVVVSLVLVGMLAGTVAGLLGVGGGIVNVPVLYFLFQFYGVSADSAMVIATGTSLAIIIPTSISSIRAHHCKGNVDWALIKRWLPFMAAGVIVGSWLLTLLDGRYFTLLFAAIALFTAFNLLFRSTKSALAKSLPTMPAQGLLGTAIGFLSVMVGIGGGTLGVAILTAYNYAMHRAVGTSAAFGFIISLPGALFLCLVAQTPLDAPLATWGYINLLALIIIMPLSVAFAPLGVRLGARLDENKLKKVFALVLALTAIRMLLQVLLAY